MGVRDKPAARQLIDTIVGIGKTPKDRAYNDRTFGVPYCTVVVVVVVEDRDRYLASEKLQRQQLFGKIRKGCFLSAFVQENRER